jgi:hypothetical protein
MDAKAKSQHEPTPVVLSFFCEIYPKHSLIILFSRLNDFNISLLDLD